MRGWSTHPVQHVLRCVRPGPALQSPCSGAAALGVVTPAKQRGSAVKRGKRLARRSGSLCERRADRSGADPPHPTNTATPGFPRPLRGRATTVRAYYEFLRLRHPLTIGAAHAGAHPVRRGQARDAARRLPRAPLRVRRPVRGGSTRRRHAVGDPESRSAAAPPCQRNPGALQVGREALCAARGRTRCGRVGYAPCSGYADERT
jgi:hypothetical protein